MTSLRRRRPLEIWPAYVDATASLLMVVVFVLLVAVVGQQFLTLAIGDRDTALARLTAQVNSLSELLSLEESRSAELDAELALRSASLARAESSLIDLTAQLQQREAELAESSATIATQSTELSEQARQMARLSAQIAALETLRDRIRDELAGVLSERDDIQARLSQELQERITRLAEVERLNTQIAEVRRQLAEISRTLDLRTAELDARDLEIRDLGNKLNLALANEAARLQRYRSEFFGRLREALADTPGVEIVGDRFVLPSELLFASGSDELDAGGRRQAATLAAMLDTLMREIPTDIDWILRIDGHTDRRPIHTERFPSNWELSTARAISLARELMRSGVPATRLAPTGFAEFHPLDAGEGDAALARNRRIELKLSSR